MGTTQPKRLNIYTVRFVMTEKTFEGERETDVTEERTLGATDFRTAVDLAETLIPSLRYSRPENFNFKVSDIVLIHAGVIIE